MAIVLKILFVATLVGLTIGGPESGPAHYIPDRFWPTPCNLGSKLTDGPQTDSCQDSNYQVSKMKHATVDFSCVGKFRGESLVPRQ